MKTDIVAFINVFDKFLGYMLFPHKSCIFEYKTNSCKK